MVGYESDIEVKMQRLFETLSEKYRRRYAGIEAAKLGHGGIGYRSVNNYPDTVRWGVVFILVTPPHGRPCVAAAV